MRIIRFGTYSFKIKSYSSNEIGLRESPNMTFIIYQRIFHFWYIPIYPIDKFWTINDSVTGKQITDTTPKMRSAIDLKLIKQKTPIWSYSGLLLLAIPILFLLIYAIYGSVNEIVAGSKKNIAKNNRIDLKEELVRDPQINDLYTFKTLNVDRVTDMNGHFVKYEPSYYSSPYNVDYMVNYISRDSIGFEFLKRKSFDYAYGLKKEFRLSKKDLILATKNFQDLKVYEYQKKSNAKSKDIVGIFKISREQQQDNN
ncbi:MULTISPECIES: hypothetical protein [Arenibacter]|uniref:hypothetical protein n=1 Tax=Arenibacter TaxID=178469 RepID=UPI001C06CDDB|nr:MULTISPECIES: hypothetical protein [Arenibacter]MBU2903571.1 hypothetical protein [Arenibacter algicola]MCK0135039.1 hypothetical protein [Arenibacter sp. S6351L]